MAKYILCLHNSLYIYMWKLECTLFPFVCMTKLRPPKYNSAFNLSYLEGTEKGPAPLGSIVLLLLLLWLLLVGTIKMDL